MSTCTVKIYTSYKQVPLELVDPICGQMACLDIECMSLYRKLGLTANYDSSPIVFKKDEFGPNTPENSIFFVLMDAFKLAGYSLYRRNAGTARISALYVAPGYRHQGNGRALLKEMLSYAERRYPYESIEIGVIANNTPALNLYRDLGFTISTHYTFMKDKKK